jgi:hypothetical protein
MFGDSYSRDTDATDRGDADDAPFWPDASCSGISVLHFAYPKEYTAGCRGVSHNPRCSPNHPSSNRILEPIFVLSGFFDGTGSPDGTRFLGVAGYLFDDAGLIRFRNGYEDLRSEFRRGYGGLEIGIFHATECCGPCGREQYQSWIPELRWRLCRKVAELTKECRLAGFVSFALNKDRDEASELVIRRTGDIYPLALIQCIDHVAGFARGMDEKVFYWGSS